MATQLLLAAAVIFACVVLNRITGRLGIPMLLAFILLGMFFGSDGVVKIPFDNYGFAEQICSVALIFIMFYGGFGTRWSEAKPVAAPAVALSSLGVVLTAAITGVFCHFALGIDWVESFLLGSIIGSTDAASVFSILRSRHLNLRYNTASLLEVESGSNDPFAYMLTAIFMSILNGSATGGGIAYMIFAQVVYGVGAGVIISVIAVYLLKRIKFATPGFDGACVIAIALLAYAAPAALGGNGYLSAYIVGIVLGNADIRHKRTLVPFFDGVTGLMQMLIFFLLGLLSFPSRIPQVILPALAIALFLTFVARPLAVFGIMAPFGSRLNQRLVISWAGLRGAASIVFAVMATMSVRSDNDIFHIVFCIVLFSILLQGSLLPVLAKKLGMLDADADVMKTFSDYSSEIPVRFIQFTIPETHKWCGMAVRDITLPPDTLLALLRRGESEIVPNGGTVLLSGDTVILSARSPESIDGVALVEEKVEPGSANDGCKLADMPRRGDMLVILMIRGEKIIIPNGETVLQGGDLLVINHAGQGEGTLHPASGAQINAESDQ